MNNIRLIASDVDGTLLPKGGAISEGLREAVGRCRARGIPFILASGRWIGALRDIVEQSGTAGQPCIIANGAAVIGPSGETLREWLLDPRDSRRVYEILQKFDVQINGYLRGKLYCLNTQALKQPSSMIKGYLGGENRVVIDDRAAFEAEALGRAFKLEALSEDRAVVKAVKHALDGLGLSITHSSPRNVEIMAPGVGKGAALKWLAGELGIPLGNCMAFGDNMNDMDLLSAVGWPVAMGNAEPALKRAAIVVAPTDREDGVAKVIREYVLGERE